MKAFKIIFLILFLLMSGINTFAADADENSVKEFFQEYIGMGENFDTSIADLYLDSAIIRNLRRYPNGSEKSMQLTGVQWKALITKVMPVAKARGRSQVHHRRQTAGRSQRSCLSSPSALFTLSVQRNLVVFF